MMGRIRVGSRPQWKAYQDRIGPARLVFIDET